MYKKCIVKHCLAREGIVHFNIEHPGLAPQISEFYGNPFWSNEHLYIYDGDELIGSTDPVMGLPRPSKGFLDKYCELGGIEQVSIEFTEDTKEPKVAPDNTLTIRKVKDSWNKEEVKALLNNLYFIIVPAEEASIDYIDKWIEDHL